MEDKVKSFGLINFVKRQNVHTEQNARMYTQNKLLKDFLKFLEKNISNLKKIWKVFKGSGNILLLNCLLKNYFFLGGGAFINFNLKPSLPSKISLYAF